MPKIFISYRRADSAMLATLMQVKLQSFGIDAFVDTRSIDGGGLFPNRLRRAIENADVFVCLLGATTLESSYVQEEILHAYRTKKVMIPVFQERYKAPDPAPEKETIQTLLQSDGVHIFDVKNVYIDSAIADLAKMIRETLSKKSNIRSASTLPLTKPPRPDKSILSEPFEWVHIPAGDVTLEAGGYILKGGQTFAVDDFYIAKYPLTNAQYAIYVNESGKKPDYWNDAKFNRPLQPVVGISWQDAIDYCEWLSSKIAYDVTLPTEQQWQRAAQGDNNQRYPWGENWDASLCNNIFAEKAVGKTTPINQYPSGVSPYGLFDMSGNVWEWCRTAWKTGLQDVKDTSVRRILRGGSWFSNHADVFCCTYRGNWDPGRNDDVGFRLLFASDAL